MAFTKTPLPRDAWTSIPSTSPTGSQGGFDVGTFDNASFDNATTILIDIWQPKPLPQD